jgi:hypothetical protein
MDSNFLKELLIDATRSHFYEPQDYTFRGSSLPYCATRDALSQCLKKTNSLPTRDTPLTNQFLMDIGTAYHALIQKALGMKGLLFGNWVCDQCKKVTEMKLGPQVHCRKPMSYKELRVLDPEIGFSGSADGVLVLNGKNILIDFKTTDSRKLSKLGEVNFKHRLQVLAYKYYLSREPYNLKIEDSAIVYVSRENLEDLKVLLLPKDDLEEQEFLRFVSHKKQVPSALKEGTLLSLPMYCRNFNDDPYCPYTGYCFSPEKKDHFLRIWERYRDN